MSLYVYAVVRGPRAGRLGRGASGERLRVLSVAGLGVVTGSRTRPPRVTTAALRRHDATIRRIATHSDAVLPVRFGTLVADTAALTHALAARAPVLRKALRLVAGHEQMTLRVYGEPTPRRPGRDALDGGPGRRYLARRLAAQRAPEVDPLRRALRGLVAAERVERHERPPLLASVYHLVRRGDSDRYLATVAAASDRLDGVRVRPSGPWPAYAFAPDAVA